MKSPELYTWQKEAIDAWVKKECKGTVMATTGAGKTRVALEIIREWLKTAQILGQKHGIVVIVPTRRLMQQWYHELLDLGIDRVGRYGGKYQDKHLNVVVSTVNSARKLFFSNENTLLICDEAHRMATDANKKIFHNIKFSGILGLSATPDRADGKDVTKFTGDIVYRLGYEQAVNDGIIPEFTINLIRTSLTSLEWNEYMEHTKRVATFLSKIREVWGSNANPMTMSGEQDENVIFFKAATQARKRAVNSSAERFDVLRELLNQHRGEKVAVFHESVDDIEEIAHEYRQLGWDVDVYHSDTSYGDKQFVRWCESIPDEGRVLFSCKALKEGINVPSMQVVIMMSGTNDARSRIQTLGRGLRGSAATIYLIYAVGTTDVNGWQQMMEVGQIPEKFIVEHQWTAHTIKRITPIPLQNDIEFNDEDEWEFDFEGFTLEEDEWEFDFEGFTLEDESTFAHSKLDNQQTQIETCAQPVPPDQIQELKE
jgi:superfamily II DNA or RNA helicase